MDARLVIPLVPGVEVEIPQEGRFRLQVFGQLNGAVAFLQRYESHVEREPWEPVTDAPGSWGNMHDCAGQRIELISAPSTSREFSLRENDRVRLALGTARGTPEDFVACLVDAEAS